MLIQLTLSCTAIRQLHAPLCRFIQFLDRHNFSLNRVGTCAGVYLVLAWLLYGCFSAVCCGLPVHFGKASEVAAGLGIARCPGQESPLHQAASLLLQSPTEPRNDVPTGGSAVLKPCTCRDVASSTVVVVTVVVVCCGGCCCCGLRLAMAAAGILKYLLLVFLVLSLGCCCSCSCCCCCVTLPVLGCC